MITSLDSILGSGAIALDGEVGKVFNVLFDDLTWAIRHFVVETGSWYTRRRVLISPTTVDKPDWRTRTIPVFLTKEQVQSSPDSDTAQPVSRQNQLALSRHYGWTDYLSTQPFPSSVEIGASNPEPEDEAEEEGDPHLRSAKEVAGYRVKALDGNVGTVTDFLIEDTGWAIADLVVHPETGGRNDTVLIPTVWITAVSWEDQIVQLNQPSNKAIHSDFINKV